MWAGQGFHSHLGRCRRWLGRFLLPRHHCQAKRNQRQKTHDPRYRRPWIPALDIGDFSSPSESLLSHQVRGPVSGCDMTSHASAECRGPDIFYGASHRPDWPHHREALRGRAQPGPPSLLARPHRAEWPTCNKGSVNLLQSPRQEWGQRAPRPEMFPW